MSGQSIVDRLNAAKHTVAGSALGRAVVKATTEEIMGPKRKHLEYLLACTSELNVSIPQMADLLIERTQNTSWVVTYKSLITIHHLMCYGNERFSQYMASHNSKFTLNNFMDKTGIQGIDMSSYIRKYAHYLNEKRETYKLMGFDFCKVKRGKDDGMLRTMTAEKLLKALPILQKQLDALVQFDIQANELTNGVINSCFVLLSKDLIRLFACYNDGIINLLEKFFDMNKKMCKEALDVYRKFLERTDNVSTFLKVAESSGMDKGDIPDLTKAPSSLLDALEAHVNGPDSKKTSTLVVSNANNNASAKSSAVVSSAINSLNSNSALLSAEEKRRVLEEEAKTLESFKKNHLKNQTSMSSPSNENPYSSSNGGMLSTNGSLPKLTSNQDDLFGLDLTNANNINNSNTIPSNGSSASDDLLMLTGANPFIQNIVNQSYAIQPTNPIMNPFQSNGIMTPGVVTPSQINLFQQPNFQNNQINGPQNKIDDLFSGLNLTTTQLQTNSANSAKEFDAFGDVLMPTNKNVLNPVSSSISKLPNSNGVDKTDLKILSTDLESSLASLADNLDINHKNKNFQKYHQWNTNSQQNQIKTGGQNWSKASMPANVPVLSSPITNTWNSSATNNQNWNVNPFAVPIQTANQIINTTQQSSTVQSSNPFDLF